MTISPFQRRNQSQSKPAEAPKSKAKPAGVSEATALGVELYGGVESFAVAIGVNPKKLARQVAFAFSVAADARALGVELSRMVAGIPPEVRDRYAVAFETLVAQAFPAPGVPAEPPPPEPTLPSLEFPTPGPDLGTVP